MPAPMPQFDVRPLFVLADQFEDRSAALRVRARMVGQAPHAAGWYSAGARAFARSADEAAAALLVVAGRMQRGAEEIRALAAAAAVRGGGR